MQTQNYISPKANIVDCELGNNVKIYKDAIVKNSKIGDYVSIGDAAIVQKSYLKSNSEINRRNWVTSSIVGNYTYTGLNTVIYNAQIGNFCSISWNVSIGGDNHDLDKVTTSRLQRYFRMDTGKIVRYISEKTAPCVIGHDVWIGSNAVVLRNVCVSNGAVIGAGAVVTKDVEPYSVVAGVPARVIKKRFDDKTIEALEKIKWWDWPKEIIRNNLDLIYFSTVDEKVIERLMEISDAIKK